MKRTFVLILLLVVSMAIAFADTHFGRTEATVVDSSFIVQGYYKGEEQDTGVTLEFRDIDNNRIIHSTQTTTGTKVNASDRHVGSNTGTIFTWSMIGSTNDTVEMTFSFTTMQAKVNGYYYRPTYTLKMTINQTRKNSSTGNTMTDTFYSNASPKTQVVGGGSTTGTKASQQDEFTEAASITYRGKTSNASNKNKWYRSGTCTLNISDYEEDIPGDYQYVCWVVAEFTVQ